jgi:acetyl-CoA acetyltransferase
VTSGEIARRINPQPAYILGYGEHHGFAHVSQAANYMRSSAVETGPRAFRMAGLKPSDIDVVETYDAFTAHAPLMLENLGFFEPGKASAAIADGYTAPGGPLPQNTYGGLLSFGHVGDASGMSMIVEGARQVMGICGERQVKKANRALVHVFGGMLFEHSTLILGREQ